MGLLLGLGLPALIVIPFLVSPERGTEFVAKGFAVLAPILAVARLALAGDRWRRDRAKKKSAR